MTEEMRRATPEFAMMRVVNPFVYGAVQAKNMEYPTIPPWIHESYAQCYEDVILVSLIKVYGMKIQKPIMLTYVEIGANHPVCTSTTYLLQRTFGCTGILVEPNPKLAQQLRIHRSNDFIIEAAVVDQVNEQGEIDFFLSPENEISSTVAGHVLAWKQATLGIQEKIIVKTITANDILSKINPEATYVMSIDVEGLDLKILKSIDFTKHKPLAIVIEPSEDNNPGTVEAMVKHMSENGYVLIGMNFVNLIFQRTDCL